MRPLILVPLFTLILLTRSVAYAEGLIRQLPADGSWVRFDMKGEGDTGGKEDNIAGTITIRSVGRASHEGEQCRWIEFKAQTADHIDVFKVLVPEKYLAKPSNSVKHMIRGWRKSGDEEPQEVREATPEIIALIGPPLMNVKKLEPVLVESKLGKLECKGITGTWSLQADEMTVNLTVTARLHSKAPFGVVTYRTKFESIVDGEVVDKATALLTLADFGKDAISDLPDHQ